MARVALLFCVITLCCCACAPVITGKQVLSEEKMETVTASGEDQEKTIRPDTGEAQLRFRTTQDFASPPLSQEKSQPMSPPATSIPFFNQTNSILQTR